MSIHDEVQPQTPSERVTRAVAAREGVEWSALETPLFEVVDPDALDSIVSEPTDAGSPPVRVRFTYCGYEVSVASDGSVRVSDRL